MLLFAFIGCAVLGVAFSRLRVEFVHGFQRMELSPDAAFVVFAAITLPPAAAALVGMLTALGAARGRTLVHRVFVMLTGSGAAAAAAVMADLVSSAPANHVPPAHLMLPAVLAAAITRAVVTMAGTLLYAELRQRRGAGAMVRSTPVRALLALEALLPTATIAMCWGYVDRLWLALTVLAAAQGFTWVVLRIVHARFTEQTEYGQLRSQVARYLPQPVAAGLTVGGAQDAGAAPILGGELRNITVMFIDIRSFTSWAESTEPDDVMTELNRLLTDLSESILATDGTIDKFTGDGLMAFWGAPNDQPDHAARALKAVPRMLMRVREMNIRRSVQRSRPLEIGIGMNTGVAMVGNVGHHDRLSYTAVGDTVNLAARLEQATRIHDVPMLLSEDSFLELPIGMQRQLCRLDSITVKGRRDRVRLYTPKALAAQAEASRREVAAAASAAAQVESGAEAEPIPRVS